MAHFNLYTRRRGNGSLFIYSSDFDMVKFKFCNPILRDGKILLQFHNGPKLGNSITINKNPEFGVTGETGGFIKIAQTKWLGTKVKNKNFLNLVGSVKIVSTDDLIYQIDSPVFI